MSTLESLVGVVGTVDDVPAGGDVSVDHPAGATELALTDASDFAEAGGQVSVLGHVLVYTRADLATDVLHLAEQLPVAVESATAVHVHPRSPSRVATVHVDGQQDGLTVRVPQSLLDQVPTGLRDPAAAETVTVDLVDGVWTVTDLLHVASRAVGPEVLAELEDARAHMRDLLDALRVQLDDAAEWIADSGAALDTLLAGPDVIPQSVIDRLWTNIVRSRKITTDMLMVGSGENLVPDPHLTDAALTDARLSLSTGAWTTVLDGGERVAQVPAGSTSTLRYVAAPGGITQRCHPVTPGHTYRVRYDYRGLTDTLALPPSLRPAVRWLTAAGTAYTTYPRTDTVRTGTTWQTDEVEWTAPDSAVAAYLEVVATGGSATTIQLRRPSITSKTDASLIVDGSVAARHISAESVAAALADFIRVRAEHILAGDIDVALNLTAGALIQVGAVGEDHVVIADGAVVGNHPAPQIGVEGGVPVYDDPVPAVVVGGTGSAFRVLDDQGSILGGIGPDGSVLTPRIDAGQVVMAGDDLATILAGVSQGTMVWSGVGSSTTGGPYSTRTGVWEFDFEAVGGRRYRIDIGGEWEGTVATIVGLKKTEAPPGSTPPTPTVTSPELDTPFNLRADGALRYESLTWWYRPNSSEHARFLLYVEPIAGHTVRHRRVSVTVTDIGLSPSNTGQASLGGAATQPPEKDVVKTIPFVAHATWSQYGRDSSYKTDRLRHGRTSGMSGIYRSYLPFTTSMLNLIGSATSIDKVEIRLTRDPFQGSSTPHRPYLGTINTGSVAGSTEPTTYHTALAAETWGLGETDWSPLSAAQVAAIASGTAKGISVGRTSVSPWAEYAAPGRGSGVQPVLRFYYKTRS